MTVDQVFASFVLARKEARAALAPLIARLGVEKIKSSRAFSHETLCFKAIVTLDGKRVGIAENSGHGGGTDVWFDDRETGDAMYKSFENVGLDEVIDDMVHDALRRKDWVAFAKRINKKGHTALFFKDEYGRDNHGSINTSNRGSADNVIDGMRAKGCVIVEVAYPAIGGSK